MTLPEKIKAVEQLHAELDEAVNRFQMEVALHCPPGCGRCCNKPDIEASVLEFLPLAMQLYRQGEAEIWLEQLKSEKPLVCRAYQHQQAHKGRCMHYPYRGLICRLFGYAARINKYNFPELVTCQVIKNQEGYAQAKEKIQTGTCAVPYIRHWYMRLQGIDPALGTELLPVNEAICRALEMVLLDMSYRLSA